jgi:hypothetical protein
MLTKQSMLIYLVFALCFACIGVGVSLISGNPGGGILAFGVLSTFFWMARMITL